MLQFLTVVSECFPLVFGCFLFMKPSLVISLLVASLTSWMRSYLQNIHLIWLGNPVIVGVSNVKFIILNSALLLLYQSSSILKNGFLGSLFGTTWAPSESHPFWLEKHLMGVFDLHYSQRGGTILVSRLFLCKGELEPSDY